MRLLASQAAVSLENAYLHAELINENRDRQHAEDELRASEERWRSLFENVPMGVALIAPQGHYLAVNQALQTMLGYSEAELLGRSPTDVTHEDDRAVSEGIRAARAAGDTRIFRREKRYRRKDGDTIWADVSSFLLPVARGTPLEAAFAVDITDRKRAEEDLRRSETFLIQAQQISQTGSWYWDVRTGEVRWSAEHYRIFGYDPTSAQPSYPTFTERMHPEDRPSVEQTIATAVAEKGHFQLEYRIVLPDGSVKHLLSLGRPRMSASGDLEYVGTVMDITERKRAEEALRDAQANLATVARLTTLGELAASLAHEMNQPLASIVTNCQAGLRWLNRKNPDLGETQQALSRAVRDATRAADIIRGLRALARKTGPQMAPFDIDDAIREVLALTSSELRRHGVRLRTGLSASGQPVLGDRIQLQQVVLNLVMNGIQAYGGGYGTPERAYGVIRIHRARRRSGHG